MRIACLVLVAGCGFEVRVAAIDASVDAPVDAEAIDAPWHPGLCPPGYDVLTGQSSLYRVVEPRPVAAAAVWAHIDDCADDLPGATHLVAVDDLNELTVIRSKADAIGELYPVWIGGVQLRDQELATGWLSFTGGPLLDAWYSPFEPLDHGATTGTEDNEEQFVALLGGGATPPLGDGHANINGGAICECDGKPIDPVVAAELAATRP